MKTDDDELRMRERIHDARAKLALVLGGMQGNAVAHIPFDTVLLSFNANGQTYGITWGELALCAGADRYGGPDK